MAQWIERLANVLERRRFLRGLAATTAAVIMGVLGLSKPVYAGGIIECCNLCFNPASCEYSNCNCVWQWTCCQGENRFSCKECYTIAAPCGPGCAGAKCSKLQVVGACGP